MNIFHLTDDPAEAVQLVVQARERRTSHTSRPEVKR
jgi:hypothetical protein